MSSTWKKYLTVAALLLVTAFLTSGVYYSTGSSSDKLYTRDIPMLIGDWYGRELHMDEITYEILETRDASMREYANSNGETVVLVVVVAQNNRRSTHPPETCFAGAGWSVVDRDMEVIKIGGRSTRANKLVLRKESEKRVVLYVYKAGKRLTHSYYRQQFSIVLNGLLHRSSFGALIRISVPVVNGDIKAATVTGKEFARKAVPVLLERLP